MRNLYLRPALVKQRVFNFHSVSCLGIQLACSALLSTLLSSLCVQEVNAAMPQSFNADTSLVVNDTGEIKNARDEAVAEISGSPWPGVIDHLLQSPIEINEENTRSAGIHINYPSFGQRNVDADIRSWVETVAATFQTHLDTDIIANMSQDEDPDSAITRFLQDDDLNSEAAGKSIGNNNFELWGSYSISRPSADAVSITYELWNYIDSDKGNLDIITLNYNLLNGQRLNFVDIFENPEIALQLMSVWTRNQLAGKLGEGTRNSMLKSGTEPLLDNFSSITLTPEGLRINFQPWQVAPWDAGIQKVDMPLEELMDASPLLSLWGREEAPKNKGNL